MISSRIAQNRILSPPILPQKATSNISPDSKFLSELDEIAQQSIHSRVHKQTQLEFKEDLAKLKKPQKKLQKMVQIRKTKQPSLPYLQSNQYYDKWYIPYDQRYIRKYVEQKPQYQGNQIIDQDEQHFYNNLHKLQLDHDPFVSGLSSDQQRTIEQNQRCEVLRDILKQSKAMLDFKKTLESKSVRIPAFVKVLVKQN
ncbi:hypothetical protein pb186bvf_005287 [Paramecium bursaria]